jgi:hypothetical protein
MYITYMYELLPSFVERRGRMVRMSDSQPEGRGLNPGQGTAWYL